jgi:hypothetical protein
MLSEMALIDTLIKKFGEEEGRKKFNAYGRRRSQDDGSLHGNGRAEEIYTAYEDLQSREAREERRQVEVQELRRARPQREDLQEPAEAKPPPLPKELPDEEVTKIAREEREEAVA